jgi:hypothetical protein
MARVGPLCESGHESRSSPRPAINNCDPIRTEVGGAGSAVYSYDGFRPVDMPHENLPTWCGADDVIVNYPNASVSWLMPLRHEVYTDRPATFAGAISPVRVLGRADANDLIYIHEVSLEI